MALEARENAETVWYSLIWEETKEASNVVDYNINEEITKDNTAVENANNQTTTGMANVIPWVNAPKLIADTSIIWGWLSVTKLSASQSMWQSSTAINTYVIDSWSWDVYLDVDYPARMYTSGWTYLIGVYIKTHNANASVTWYMVENKPSEIGNYFMHISQGGGSTNNNTYTAIVNPTDWTYYRIYLTIWWSTNYTINTYVTFVKLW